MNMREEKLKAWSLLFDERKQRNIAIKEFCKEKGVSVSSYYYYQDLINKPDKVKKHTKISVKNSSNIKPVQIINSRSKENDVIRFILPNSLQCILPRDMSLDEIKKILDISLSC
jgi:hypothetical protein